jgi:hypothetical protein
VTGALLKGLTMVECESYGVSKAHEVILRRPPTRSSVPFYRIYLNLIPGIIAYNSDKYAVYFLNNAIRINKVETIVKKSLLT